MQSDETLGWLAGQIGEGFILTNPIEIFKNRLFFLRRMSELKGQPCHLCGEKKLILKENEMQLPYFGKIFILSMECEGCGFKKSDIEPAEEKEPARFTFEMQNEEDLNVRIVKSADATVKIPHVITIEPGVASEGYVTNVEGLLTNIKKTIESSVEGEEDEDVKNKGRNLIKKLSKALVGREKLKIIIEDPSGHSAIISDKAQRSKL